MAPTLDPKTDFQVTTIRRIIVDRARPVFPAPAPGAAPVRGNFVVFEDRRYGRPNDPVEERRCLHLGPDFTAVIQTAWQNGVPEDLTYDWVNELLDRPDLFPVAGPAKYILDLEAAYNFVKAKHPRAMMTRFWTDFDWSSAPRVGGFIIDTLQQILNDLPKSPRHAELGEKLYWGEILRWGARRLMVLDSCPALALTAAWPDLRRLPDPHGFGQDQVALDLMSSAPGVFPSDGCGNHGIFSHYDTVVLDLDEAFTAIKRSQPWSNVPRPWDVWDWRRAPVLDRAEPDDEVSALRQEVVELRTIIHDLHRAA